MDRMLESGSKYTVWGQREKNPTSLENKRHATLLTYHLPFVAGFVLANIVKAGLLIAPERSRWNCVILDMLGELELVNGTFTFNDTKGNKKPSAAFQGKLIHEYTE